MSVPATLPRKPSSSTALDYHQLRRLGIAFLQRVASGVWTDYNVHDPGVTLLETAVYGTTDAAYRASFPDEVLFNRSRLEPGPAWVTAPGAFGQTPVTANDFRRLFLDRCPELRQVWVEPAPITGLLRADTNATPPIIVVNAGAGLPLTLRGTWNIRLLFHTEIQDAGKKPVFDRIVGLFHKHRPLGGDLAAVLETPTSPVTICAEIRLQSEAHVEATHAAIVQALRQFLNPTVQRHTLEQLRARGLPPEDIYSGPPLAHGFILEEELEATASRATLRTSDLLRVIQGVKGVDSVGRFQLAATPQGGIDARAVDWELTLPPGHEPKLDFEEARFLFLKGPLPFRSDATKAKAALTALEAATRQAAEITCGAWPIPTGQDPGRLDDFTTLQDILPAVYGVGLRNFDPQAPGKKLGQARQLQSYLLILDQMLANLTAQIEHVSTLLSAQHTGKRSLHSVRVADLPAVEALLPKDYDTYLGEVMRQTDTDWIQRRTRVVDHLLARWGESFVGSILARAGGLADEEILDARRQFLSQVAALGERRGCACEIQDPVSVSTLEQRLGHLLGFHTAAAAGDGLVVIESILLRPRGMNANWAVLSPPCEAAGTDPAAWDPYSHHVHFIFNGETKRFSQPEFRLFAETLITRDFPAHLCPKICFTSTAEFEAVRDEFAAWRKALGDPALDENGRIAALTPVITRLKSLHTIYPYGKLHDCVEDQDETSAIILGRSHLGVRA